MKTEQLERMFTIVASEKMNFQMYTHYDFKHKNISACEQRQQKQERRKAAIVRRIFFPLASL